MVPANSSAAAKELAAAAGRLGVEQVGNVFVCDFLRMHKYLLMNIKIAGIYDDLWMFIPLKMYL